MNSAPAPARGGRRTALVIGLLFALVGIGGSIARDLAAHQYGAAAQVAIYSGLAVVGGGVIGLGFFVAYLPAGFRRRRISRLRVWSLVMNTKTSFSTRAPLSEVAEHEGWALPLPNVFLGFTVTADSSGLFFWGASKPLRPFGQLSWGAIARVAPILAVKGDRTRPRLVIETRDGPKIDFFLSSSSWLGMGTARQKSVQLTGSKLEELRNAWEDAASNS
jgi:hypothetical protein